MILKKRIRATKREKKYRKDIFSFHLELYVEILWKKIHFASKIDIKRQKN